MKEEGKKTLVKEDSEKKKSTRKKSVSAEKNDEKKTVRKRSAKPRKPRAKARVDRPEKPAFAKEKKLFRKRSFRTQYDAFRLGGLGVFDSLFNAFYIFLSEKSLEIEKNRLQKKGRGEEFSSLEHHGIFLRLISLIPRVAGALFGIASILWKRDAGAGKDSRFEFFKKHKIAVGILFFAFAILLFVTIQLSRPVVLRAEIDGVVIGVVESKNVVDSAVNQLEDNVEIILGKNFQFPHKITYTFGRSFQKSITDKSKLSENLYSYVSDYICTAAGLYVDNVLVAVCENPEVAQSGLDELISTKAAPGETGIFNETRIVTQAYPTESILDREAYFSLLNEMLVPLEERKKELLESDPTAPDNTTTPFEEETVPAMEQVLDFTYIPKEKTVSKSNYPESTAKIKLDFYRAEYRKYDAKIPYQTVYVESNSSFTSMVDTTVGGRDGVATLEEEVYYVNGKIAGRKVIREVIKRQPVNKEISIGTKLLPEDLQNFADLGDRRFIMPCLGTVNYYFGERESGMHYGWDIPGPEGENIYAAASGTVVVAIDQNGIFSNRPNNRFTGYGHCVVIQHEDGFSTMYAHCSKVYVKLGQEVKQGEKIAAMGNTGKSDGSHLHFEIERGNVKLDPKKYIYQGKTTIYD